jgi:upstream activation factor subunit UAF30
MAAKKPAKKSAKKATATKRKPNAAFMKEMNPSKDLAEVIGSKPVPRTEVVKKLWAYIRKNNLQDAKERRMINADDKLRVVFGGKKQVSMFEMTKLVNKHLS